MTARVRQRLAGLAGLVLLAALPVVGHWLRHPPVDRCTLDGAPVEPLYRVRNGGECAFCCVRCAELWLTRQGGRPEAVFVTDETSGEELPAAASWFVRSSMVTTATSGNRVHAFARRADAERHAESAGGRLLAGKEHPFADTD